jgi:hypothetical protein
MLIRRVYLHMIEAGEKSPRVLNRTSASLVLGWTIFLPYGLSSAPEL